MDTASFFGQGSRLGLRGGVMEYAEMRDCADVMGRVLSFQCGAKIRLKVNLDADPKRAANQQAAYGLRKVDERVAELEA